MNHVVSFPDGSALFGEERLDLIRHESLAEIFATTAARLPNKTALIYGEASLTYQQLDERATTIARQLVAHGVAPGKIVGLWMPRGIELLTAQLAITKAGAAWLPFDADTPPERIQICLNDATACGLICPSQQAQAHATALDGNFALWAYESLSQPQQATAAMQHNTEIFLASAAPTDPAYVIYTSGSTGLPKGIQIHQGAVCHFLRAENAILGIQQDDRVYQGFSVAFDMSFEEIWISYLVGATLWIAAKQTATDPETLAEALRAQRISVLHTVPTLLALLPDDLPDLRLVNLGGEACPDSLANRWAQPGRQVFNTYGPTEATVSASLAELHAQTPVTIGAPLANYNLWVINPDLSQGLQLVPVGEAGELCISGPGVAQGYLRRPELTQEKFITNPWAQSERDQQLYRTGDLAILTAEGKIQCLGRTDDQVKIRGYRVELGEIEAVLATQAGVATAAVLLQNVQGVERLVAYCIAKDRPDTDTATAPSSGELRQALSQLLPPYMVPSHVEFMPSLPRLPSGKIDRKALRQIPLTLATNNGESDVAETPTEEVLFAALQQLFPGQAISREADFFTDLGGHSLFAARLASMIRTHAGYEQFTVRDIYQLRQVNAIADKMQQVLQQQNVLPATDNLWQPPPAWKRWLCGGAQALIVPLFVVLRMSQWLAPFFTYHFYTGDPGDSLPRAIAISAGAFVIATISEFMVAALVQRIFTRHIRPGRYPLWGWTYFCWWLADRMIESTPAYMLSGSPLYVWWLRLLGAKVGRETTIGSMTARAPHLLRFGDQVSVGNTVNFENVRVIKGELIITEITLARRAYVGSYAVLEGNNTIGEYGHLDGQSSLPEGAQIPPNEIWTGSPARAMGTYDRQSLPPIPTISWLHRCSENILYIFGALLVSVMFFLPAFPSFILIDHLDEYFPAISDQGLLVVAQLARYFLMSFPATAVLILCTMLLSFGLRWLFLPRLIAGQWPIHSRFYLARWFINQIQESGLNILHGIFATIYAPFWYRLLGAKVGKGAEISTAQGLIPDVLTLGDETFVADAVMLGDEEIDGGWMKIRPTVIGKRSFLGNGAFVPDGSIIPENVLIGVHTHVPDNDKLRSGDTWLGSPPINLPAREQTSGFPETLTFRPSKLRQILRGLVEAFRIITPHALVISVGYTIVLDIIPYAGDGKWNKVIYYLTLSGLLYGFVAFLLVVLMKWLFIGRYHTRSQPMWTRFVWFSEAITNLFEGVAVPNFLRYLRGTPWLPVAFRLLGCKIGRGVYLDTTDFTEFDCVHIGDYSELNALTCPQTHLFEDRIMKIDHVHIHDHVTLHPRCCVLYGAEVGKYARLGPLTLVMKGESIPAYSHWAGCPASPAQG